jgi:DNA-binding NarL/FixJ family response regulator
LAFPASHYGRGVHPQSEKSLAENQSKQWRVVIVENHPVARTQLAALIQRDANLKVCGEADVPAALPLIDQCEPDLVILDVSSERSQGFDLLGQLHSLHPKVRVLALSLHGDRLHRERVLQAGAAGFLTKQEASIRILSAIQSVLGENV